MLQRRRRARPPALRHGHHVAATRTPAPTPRAAIDDGARLVHRLPAVADRRARSIVPRHPRRRGAVGGVRRIGITGRAHRPGEARRRPRRLDADARRRRHFDRISTPSTPCSARGRVPHLCDAAAAATAARSSTTSCPGHTGKGADFRLAEMALRRLPGHLPHGRDRPRGLGPPPGRPRRAGLREPRHATEARARARGYIVGQLQRVLFYDAGDQGDELERDRRPCSVSTASSAAGSTSTTSRRGSRRSTGSTPPSPAARLVLGDALHSLGDLGAGALRLDANGFLGIEKAHAGHPAWSEGHPLSDAANHLIAAWSARSAGFTFQELNLTIDDIKAIADRGADLSYDFVTRPAYHHALATGDTEFLRLTLNAALAIGVEPGAARARAAEPRRAHLRARALRRHAPRRPLRVPRPRPVTGGSWPTESAATSLALTGPAPALQPALHHQRHRLHHGDVAAAALGIATSSDHQGRLARSASAHLLLAMFNAWQPGVFASPAGTSSAC